MLANWSAGLRVSRLPGLESIYRWQGTVEEAGEVLLLIKTSEERLPALEAGRRELHFRRFRFCRLRGSGVYLEWLFVVSQREVREPSEGLLLAVHNGVCYS